MIKHYCAYLFYGLFTCYTTLFVWGFSAGTTGVIPYISLISSVLLFAVASGLLFFYPRVASIIGLIALIGCLPCSYYALRAFINAGNLFLVFALILMLLYSIGAISSIMITFKWTKAYDVAAIRKPVKYTYVFIPIIILAIWLMSIYL